MHDARFTGGPAGIYGRDPSGSETFEPSDGGPRLPLLRVMRSTPNRDFPGTYLVTTAPCSICGRRHTHGAGPEMFRSNARPVHRVAHCPTTGGGSYYLVAAPDLVSAD